MPENIAPVHTPSAPRDAYCDLMIVDEMLPCDFSPFRNLEYSHYLSYFDRSCLVSTEGWHGGTSNAGFNDHLAHSTLAPEVKSKIFDLSLFDTAVPRLAYITFLHNAWLIYPYLEQRNVPFILQLYPGGAFEINVPESDEKLRALAHSHLCRKIIVTQTLSRRYLLERIGCDPGKIEFIYGGVYDTRGEFDFLRDKKIFRRDKETLDICFVAHRYGDDVRKKGYDTFAAVARALTPRYPHLRFHVVGDYTPDMLPLGEAEGKTTFHGRQPNSFFAAFYPAMDVILSVNRPAHEAGGAFDGFPTGACMEAGFRGVLNAISDPLSLNTAFRDDQDIILLDFDTERTIARLAELLDDPERLYRLSYRNWRAFLDVFNMDRQLWARTRVITAELLRSEALVIRPSAPLSSKDNLYVRSQIEEAARLRSILRQTPMAGQERVYADGRIEMAFIKMMRSSAVMRIRMSYGRLKRHLMNKG